jgi:hypothetical protein
MPSEVALPVSSCSRCWLRCWSRRCRRSRRA